MNDKYYVYILKSEASGKTYTGFTTELKNRMKQHNENLQGYTKKRGPWELVWYGVFNNRDIAKCFEMYLKSGSGIAFARRRLVRM
jgi:putative endonuclease